MEVSSALVIIIPSKTAIGFKTIHLEISIQNHKDRTNNISLFKLKESQYYIVRRKEILEESYR